MSDWSDQRFTQRRSSQTKTKKEQTGTKTVPGSVDHPSVGNLVLTEWVEEESGTGKWTVIERSTEGNFVETTDR